MPRGELRTSGVLQAAVVALLLAALFHDSPADSPAKTWPQVAAAYALLAATAPWLAGGVDRRELGLRATAILGVVGALPFAGAAVALHDTPYRWPALGFAALVALWGVHALVAIALAVARPRAD